MRYDNSFIENLKQQVDIVRLVQGYVPLKKKGNSYWGNCPFHGEKTPSFSVSPKGFFHCFGCSAKGSAFNFVMQIENVGFGEAIKIIAEKQGVALPAPKAFSKADEERYHAQKKQEQAKKSEAEIVVKLNLYALEFWENHLQENNSEARIAREYLQKRGITDETRQTFKLGYAPDKWDALIGFLKSKGADEREIELSGLVSKNEEKKRVYDRFRGRVMFPVLDVNGNPIAFGARILAQGEPKYLNSPETAAYTKGDNLYGLFQNAQTIRQKKHAILVEGYLDLITPYQHGIKNCVASLGTALTPNQARLLNRYCKRVKVNYDGDNAGVKAAKRAIQVLLEEDFEVKVLILPNGADPDEFVKQYGRDEYFGDKHEEEFDPIAEFIRKHGSIKYSEEHSKRSTTFAPFVLEQAAAGRDLRNSAEKVAAFDDVLPFLRVIKNTIQRQELFDAAINRFGIDETHRAQLLKTLRQDAMNSSKPEFLELRQRIEQAARAKPTVAEQELLELLVPDRELRDQILPAIEPPDYEYLASADIFKAIIELHQNNQEITAETLTNKAGESELLAMILMSETAREPDEAMDEVLTRAETCVLALRQMAVDRRLREIKDELAGVEQAGEMERMNRLILEQLELSRLRNELTAANS